MYQRNETKAKGITKLTFSSYYSLPGILSDRLFSVFNTSKTGYVDVREFITGMKTLFCGGFDKSSKFVFDFYDFDKDGCITREEIRTVLSHVTLSTDVSTTSTGIQGYLARVHSQEELHSILSESFKHVEGHRINYEQFLHIIETNVSDIYLFILLFLLDKKPFSRHGVNEYGKQTNIKASPTRRTPSKYVASPSVSANSTLASSQIFVRESKKRRTLQLDEFEKEKAQRILGGNGSNSVRSEAKKRFTVRGNASINLFLKKQQQKDKREEVIIISESSSATSLVSATPVHRKTKTNLKNIKHEASSHKTIQPNASQYEHIELMPAYKQENLVSKEQTQLTEIHCIEDEEDNFVFENSDEEEAEEVIKHEGYLYKILEGKKPKRIWFKLVDKDLYFFKNDKDTTHRGMHNLSGVFLKEKPPLTVSNTKYFSFSVVYPTKDRTYYCDNESQYKIWIAKLKQATGFTNLTDLYEIEQVLGNGKFGLVKLGVNKLTSKKVAIKIMTKKDMDNNDKELVRTEIEILKVCQHPNIIHLYEVFENEDYYYLIMEHCAGGDLFAYLEQRRFRLKEETACRLVHKLCAALYYIHSYGIVHRDIKPENVLMTSNGDDADVRLLDFGLGKILGPEEYCTEPYGTLSYVAPEVLLERPYRKEVDLWSLGITTYLMLCGSLPFDHPSDDKEIAKQTVNDPLPFKGSVWRSVSNEAIDFVNRLLVKDPSKRMTVKDALEHEWIKKYHKERTHLRKESRNESSSVFKVYSSVDDV